MTLRQLGRHCPILLAIMLTGIVERLSCAQVSGQASKPDRDAMPLEPPPRQLEATSTEKTQTPADSSKPASATSLRIVLEMAPPTKKAIAITPPAKKVVELDAPKRSVPTKLVTAQETQVTQRPSMAQLKPSARVATDLNVPAQSGPPQNKPILSPPALLTGKGAKGIRTLDAPRITAPEVVKALESEAAAESEPAIEISSGVAPRTSAGANIPDVAKLAPVPALSLPAPSSEIPAPAAAESGLAETAESEPVLAEPVMAEPVLTEPTLTEPTLTEPYWVREVMRLSSSDHSQLQPLAFDQAIWDALAHSPYVKAVLTVPMISQAKISEASGIFDQTPFVDSIFNDTSDPVGSTLTTGGPSRLNEMRLDNAVGVRAKNRLGGTAELAQNLQLRNNNSVFLSPKEQADAKLLLRLNQPLLRGAGRAYTTSSLRIAEFNAGVTQHEAMRKLQLHAEAIAGAYWNLFAARAIEMQAQRGTERLIYLRDELLKRAEIDGLRSQLLRAEAAIARQGATKARARADVAAAEASLRALVNSPALVEGPASLMPATPPIDEPFVIDRTSELQAALAFHPDLLAARDRIKAATTRLKVAENELRPTLNVVMEGYLHGLNGTYGMGDSMVDQFSSGRPSYAGGLNYQRPYRNIVSKAILRERRLELRELLLDLDNTLLTVTAEVDQAIAAVNATYAELEASVESTIAFDAEVRYLNGRWQNAFVETTQPSLLLDELLNAQNQLIQSENSWARAQAEHMIAFAKLHVATGMLLNSMPIPVVE